MITIKAKHDNKHAGFAYKILDLNVKLWKFKPTSLLPLFMCVQSCSELVCISFVWSGCRKGVDNATGRISGIYGSDGGHRLTQLWSSSNVHDENYKLKAQTIEHLHIAVTDLVNTRWVCVNTFMRNHLDSCKRGLW